MEREKLGVAGRPPLLSGEQQAGREASPEGEVRMKGIEENAEEAFIKGGLPKEGPFP